MARLMLSGVLLLIFSLVLTGCAETTPGPTPTSRPTLTPIPTTPAAGQANVNISDFAFKPQELRVAVGTRVTWTNNDSSPHTVNSNDNLFDSPSLSKSTTFSYTFEQRGTFEYRCNIHPSMTGKVIVE